MGLHTSFVLNETDMSEYMQTDRRQNRRYDIGLPVRFKVFVSRHVVHVGTGQTVNISSRGVLFTTDIPLLPGLTVEMTISWPALYEERYSVELYLRGRVVRSDDNGAAVQVAHSCFCRVVGVPGLAASEGMFFDEHSVDSL